MSSDTRNGRASMKKYLAVLAVGAVLFTACQDDTETPSYSVAPVEATGDFNMDAIRLAWEHIPAADREAICDFYNTPPVGITPDLVRIFDDEAGLGYAESERVLSILLAEEC